MEQQLTDALNALNIVIDARLFEHGLLEPPKDKAATKPAAAKNGKAKAVEEPEIDFDSLKAKVTELSKVKGKEVAKAMLKKFKIEKLGELDEAKYTKFDAALDEALGGGAEDEDDLFGA